MRDPRSCYSPSVPILDPRVSLQIRAEFLRCVTNENAFERSATRRQEILSWLDENGWLDQVGLRLRDPEEQMPWIERDVARGSWLHWHWTAFTAMYPLDFWRAVSALSEGQASGLATCLDFLEADPWCFRSGYAKQLIVRNVRHLRLGGTSLARLQETLLIPVHAGPRIEFREYIRTARAFATPEFRVRLRQLAGSLSMPPATGTEQRARWMLEAVERD